MKISGKVRDIERRDVDGEPRVSFWLEQASGSRTQVEVLKGEQVTLGEEVEVEGKMNSEGALVADRVSRPKKPEPVMAIDEPLRPPPPPPPPINWKLWGGIAAGVLALIVIVVIATRDGDGGPKTVPDLEGLSMEQARTRLTKVGLKLVGVRLEAVNDESKVGTVIGQGVQPGTPIPEDPAKRVVGITLGAVAVPKLIDADVVAAGLALKRKGLQLGEVKVAPRVGGNSQVTDQDPPFGRAVSRGAEVSVTLATPLILRGPLNYYEQLRIRPDFLKLEKPMQMRIEQGLKKAQQ